MKKFVKYVACALSMASVSSVALPVFAYAQSPQLTVLDSNDVEALVAAIEASVAQMSYDATAEEIQAVINAVIANFNVSDGVVAAALAAVVQTAQLNGDATAVAALTTVQSNVVFGPRDSSGGTAVAQAGSNANGAGAPIASPPASGGGGGSDY